MENQYVSMAYRENIGVSEDLEILNDLILIDVK